MKQLVIAIIGMGLLIGCKPQATQNFRVDLEHFFGAEGYTLHYIVNRDSLKLYYNCDFENCKDTPVYRMPLSKEATDDFYTFLTELRYDTLKNKYITDGFDGRYTTVQIEGHSIPKKKVKLERYDHETIEQLIDQVDLLIPEIKYRLYSYKYKE